MEHIGAHLEQEQTSAAGPENWREDIHLKDWLELEGLVEYGTGGWRIGDEWPRRRSTIDPQSYEEENSKTKENTDVSVLALKSVSLEKTIQSSSDLSGSAF